MIKTSTLRNVKKKSTLNPMKAEGTNKYKNVNNDIENRKLE